MRSEIKIGLLGIAALLILIYGYKFLKGQNILESSNTYYVQYQDVAQLAVSDGVFINGFKVGSVVDMNVNRENANLIDVTIIIEGDLPLPQNTEAVLAPNGVMGQKLINLEFDKICSENCIPNKGTIKAASQGLLTSMFGEPAELGVYLETIKKNIDEDEDIKKSLTNVEKTIANLTNVTQQLDVLLTSSNASLQNVFRNLDKVTAEVAKNKEDLTTAITNLSSFSKKLNDTNIDGLMENVNTTVSSADVTIKKLESTLETTNESLKNVKGLLNSLEEGKGTMGRLLKEETLADNLDRVTKNLDLLLQDIRLNPKRYINVSVFGKKQKEYEKPEDDPAFK